MKKETVCQAMIILLLLLIIFAAFGYLLSVDGQTKNIEEKIDSCNIKIQLLAKEVIEIKEFQEKIVIEKQKPIIIVKKEFIKPCVPCVQDENIKELWYIKYKWSKGDKTEIWSIYDNEKDALQSMKVIKEAPGAYWCELVKAHIHLNN